MRSYHPRHIHHNFLRNLHIPSAFLVLLMISGLFIGTCVFASRQINFHMVINPGTLAVNIVDSSFVPVADPEVNMGEIFEGNICQSVTGVFGTDMQKIYIRNPDVADGGWNVTLSASSPTRQWSSIDNTYFDFNDPTGSGCTDGADADTVGGQMTVNPSLTSSNISLGQCMVGCDTHGIARGSSATFEEGIRDTITLLSGSPESSDRGDWVLTGVGITQTIPANQPFSDQYHLDLYLSITAT